MNKRLELDTVRVTPSETRSVEFKDKVFQGVAGDTVATALYANGVRVFGRSLKYHRPRGLYSLDGECSNTLMAVDGVPNVRAENTLLQDGMVAGRQNIRKEAELTEFVDKYGKEVKKKYKSRGAGDSDVMAFLDKLDWMMPAGFYYRTLHRPAALWPVAMKEIRKAAGLGKISPHFEMKGRYDEKYLTADVCVIGGGPAGMMAALAAADAGLRVVLMESRPHLGGFFDYRVSSYEDGLPLYERARKLSRKVEDKQNIRVFTHSPVVGVYADNLVTGFQKGKEGDSFTERYLEIRAQSVVVTTGCIERPLLFEHNERPGVMQVGCAHRLAHTYGILPGKNAVFSIGHDLGLEAAIDLAEQGLEIKCVADIREDDQDPELLLKLAEKKIPVLKGWVAAEAEIGKDRQVKKMKMTTVDGTVRREFDCDLLVASAGLTPVTGPLALAGTKMAYDRHTGFFLPRQYPRNTFAAGRMMGLNHPKSIEASGRLAGLKAAAACGINVEQPLAEAKKEAAGLPGPQRGCKLVNAPVKGRKSFICFDEDVTLKNIKQAIDKGFDVPELIKRFTGASTGPGQGGIPGHNLPLYVSKYTASSGMPVPTTVRAPLVPTLLATYAGARHHMFKRTALHESQKKEGGIFRTIGVWRRARYFSEDETCREEILNVRNNVGMLDASTLGKFRIFGPDALKALQRVYVSDMSKVKQGRIKYSAMCNEDGCVIDDGVVVKIDENDYYFTTSTGRAGQTGEWIRYHARYDGWDFSIVNLTDALGVINVSGPNARKVVQKVLDADISNEALPFAGYMETTMENVIPVRAMRLGFVGELSYELHVPSSFMQCAWDRIKEAGAEFRIRNFGVEAQNVLRMEKFHTILGQESEQRTNLVDLGLGFLWDRKKIEAKTVGAAALRLADRAVGRLKLVGIRMDDSSKAPGDGSLVVDTSVRGYVATARKSFSTGEAVGMALVESQLADIGTRLQIYEDGCNGKTVSATVVPTPFYDPEGKRMKM